jgi:hypothetical protein
MVKGLAQAVFKPDLLPCKYCNNLILMIRHKGGRFCAERYMTLG